MKNDITDQQFLKLLFEGTDLFCGAGGVTEGIHRARHRRKKIAHVRSCVNHDPLAIETHSKNHKGVHHFTEDITTQNATELFKPSRSLLNRTFLHASLECTNHSKAKGGMSRDQDSRTLAEHLYKYIDHLEPDYITIENVREFMIWGPLKKKRENRQEKGYIAYSTCLEIKKIGKGKKAHKEIKPVWVPRKERKGQDFRRWVAEVCTRGYHVEYKILNCADFGMYTSRERLIMIFAKNDLPIVWPSPTHHKTGKNGLKKWMAVKDVLNFDDEGQSIFNRKINTNLNKRVRKDLSENTLKRLYAGLIKYIAGGQEQFLAKYYSGKPEGKVITTDGPAGTITTVGSHSLVKPVFVSSYYSGNDKQRNKSTDEPIGTITTNNRHAVVKAQFIHKYFSGNVNSKLLSVNEPAGALTCIDHHSLVNADFLLGYYGRGGSQFNSIDKPCPTIPTKARFAKIKVEELSFLTAYHCSNGNPGANIRSCNDPAPTLPTNDSLSKVNVKYILNYHSKSPCNAVSGPCPTLTTKDKYSIVQPQFFLDKQYGSNDKNHQSIEVPAGSILQNDKHCLIQAENWIDKRYTNGGIHQSVDQPAGTITNVPKLVLIHADRLIMSQNFSNGCTSTNEPLTTITANRKQHYIVDMQFKNTGAEIEKPMPTLIAKMDKKPHYLVGVEFSDLAITENGELAIIIYGDDSEYTKKIKEFMALYGIIDIKMRMLRIPELKKITGFDEDYILLGSQEKQKKFIGNAVPPDLMKVVYEALYESNLQYAKTQLADRKTKQLKIAA